MHEVHDHEQELQFFTFEMDSKRKLLRKDIKEFKIEKSWYKKQLVKIKPWIKTKLCLKKLKIRTNLAILCLYKYSSHYGTSIWRPFFILIASFFIFSGLYSLPGWGISEITWSQGRQLSWGNMLPFSSMTKTVFNAINFKNPIGLCVQITTSIQNIISTGLIFLMGLAIKHKLSIK